MLRRLFHLVIPACLLLAALAFSQPTALVAQEGKPLDKADKADKPAVKAEPEKDGKSTDEPKRWGRPPGEHRPDGSRWEPFSPDELKEIIDAVQTKNPKLAEKMKERFADTLRRPPGPPPGTPGSMPTLSPEQVEKALAVFEDRSPEFAKRLRDTLKENPDRLNKILAMQWERLHKMIELKETDPEMYKAQTEEIRREDATRGLMWRIRGAIQKKDDGELSSLTGQLRTALIAKQKAENEVRKLDIERLQQKIAKLKEEIEKENANIAAGAEESLKRIMESDWINSRPMRRDGRDGNREGSRSEPVKKDGQ